MSSIRKQKSIIALQMMYLIILVSPLLLCCPAIASELQLQKCFWLPTGDELRWLVNAKCIHLKSARWFGRAITGIVWVKNLIYERQINIAYL
ncbi:unnamed protein product [Litomosoides sigmodontis]|uniref:Uncharacterized protein n=1 Tax=Litomosoides sigmodontis TaxID=42156 RepID=A0A3P6SGT0_LITSI|nr:unnamed protein product [Litomosoides sigmodontis]